MDLNLVKESGGSFAMVSPKQSKTVYGNPAVASVKLSIRGTAEEVAGDIRQLVTDLNEKLKFWKPDNPCLANGYMFNGSSQHLMNPELVKSIENLKPAFGDVDVIVPLPRLGDLEKFLDSHYDDDRTEWTPTKQNQFNAKFCYIGRPRSNHKIPDQTVTLWWYLPRKQIVQIDFEGDMMVPVVYQGKTFLRPSQWVKFSKSSPLPDMKEGIKGLAHKIMLRTLARTVYYLGNVHVLTPTGKISKAKKHEMPSLYTFNPAGMNGGLRLSYKKTTGNPDENGNPVEGYEYVHSKAIPAMPKEYAYITDIPTDRKSVV